MSKPSQPLLLGNRGEDLPLFSGTPQRARPSWYGQLAAAPAENHPTFQPPAGLCPVCRGTRQIGSVPCSCVRLAPIPVERPELITVETHTGARYLVRRRDYEAGGVLWLYVDNGALVRDLLGATAESLLRHEEIAKVVADA